jgi:glycosidase
MPRRLLMSLLAAALVLSLMPALAAAQTDDGGATASAPEWAREASIYHVFTDRFRDGDPANNIDVDPSLDFSEALRDWMGGDLAGVVEGLDHIEGLGFDTVWLGPVYENAYFHGYHPIDFTGVDANFGTVEELAELVAAVHERGMRIVYDFVPNHSSDQHPWFQDVLERCQDSERFAFYQFNEDCSEYETFFGIDELPVLDLTSADTPAAAYMLDEVVPFYLETLGFDGFRIDHAEGPSLEFWAAFRSVIEAMDGDKYAFGEVWASRSTIAEYQEVLHGALNFPLHDAFKSAIARDGDMARIDREVRADLAAYDEGFVRTSFVDNHDVQRFVHAAGNDDEARERLQQAFVTQFTLPDSPVVYYGTEVGMGQTANTEAPDGGWVDRWYREPMPWPDDHVWAHEGTDGWNEQPWDTDVADLVAELNALRDERPVLVHGDYRPAGPSRNTLAFERHDEDERLLVLIDRAGARDLSVADLVAADIPDGVTLTGLLSGATATSSDGDLVLPVGARHAEVYEVTGDLPVAPLPDAPGDEEPEQVVIAGNLQTELGCESDWDPSCTVTGLEYDTTGRHWEATFTVPAGDWEYKAALNGSWEVNYGANATLDGPDITLSLAEETEVTFLYSHRTSWVTDDVSSRIVTAPGSYQAEVGCPGDWLPDCMISWLQDPDGDGVYTWTTTDIPAGDYEVKAAVGRSWDESYGLPEDGQGTAPDGPNIPFTVPAGDVAVTFSFESATNALTVELGAVQPPDDTVQRLTGLTRVETAIAISQDSFDDADAGAVVLARSDRYPDALTGTPLAGQVEGPLLLTPSSALLEPVAAEIQRVLAPGGTVWLLGGSGALAPDVASSLEALGYEVERLQGPTRVETSIAVAEQLDADTLLVATGNDFPDALAAGAAAVHVGGAILITAEDRAHPAVTAHLDTRTGVDVYAVGGPGARAYPAMTAVSGPSREETAVEVARRFFDEPAVVGVARRDDFPDALAGGAHIGARGGPLLITATDSLHAAVADYLCGEAALEGAYVYGGTAAIDGDTAAAVGAAIRGEACD